MIELNIVRFRESSRYLTIFVPSPAQRLIVGKLIQLNIAQLIITNKNDASSGI